MLRRFRVMLVVSGCLLSAPVATATVTPSPTPPGGLVVSNPANLTVLPVVAPGQPIFPRVNGRVFFGLNDTAARDGLATSTEIGAIAAGVGASMVRLDMSWPVVQPLAGEWHWERLDDVYRGLIANGVRPLWMINGTPRFAVSADDLGTCGTGPNAWELSCDAEPDTARPENLRTFAAEFARRYPLSAGFEYRNEPNYPAGGPHLRDPLTLAENLRHFVIGAHSVRPEMRVLGGALIGYGGNASLTSYAGALLDELGGLAAEGGDVPPFISAISLHPYDTQENGYDEFAAALQGLETTLATHGQANLRVVISELGVSSQQVTLQSDRSQRMQSYFTTVNNLRDQNRYDAFVAFNAIDVNSGSERGYGWVMQKDSLGKFQALRPYCGFRTLLQVAAPLPSVVRNCLPGL